MSALIQALIDIGSIAASIGIPLGVDAISEKAAYYAQKDPVFITSRLNDILGAIYKKSQTAYNRAVSILNSLPQNVGGSAFNEFIRKVRARQTSKVAALEKTVNDLGTDMNAIGSEISAYGMQPASFRISEAGKSQGAKLTNKIYDTFRKYETKVKEVQDK